MDNHGLKLLTVNAAMAPGRNETRDSALISAAKSGGELSTSAFRCLISVILPPERYQDWLNAPAERSMAFMQLMPAQALRAASGTGAGQAYSNPESKCSHETGFCPPWVKIW